MTTRMLLPLLVLVLLFRTSPAEAGGPVGHVIIFANMTPDAESGGDSTRCAKTFFQAFKQDELLIVTKKGETKIRKAAGVPKGGPNFMRWKAGQFQSLKTYQHPYDDHEYVDYAVTVVLVDCRPATSVLDVLAIPRSNSPYRLSLRGIKITPKLTRVFSQHVLAMANRSFENY